MLARSMAVASLACGLSFGSQLAYAVPTVASSDLRTALSQPTDGPGLQKTHGWWWAGPLVIGGVIVLDHHHRYHHAYRYSHRCYRC
jgi:hypothetical protein